MRVATKGTVCVCVCENLYRDYYEHLWWCSEGQNMS